MPPQLRRVLGVTDVALFNVVAVFAMRGVTTAAKIGPMAVPLWVLAVIAFFIPLGLAVTTLVERDPGEGGLYRWTRSAFGDAHGFLAAWSYWLSNLTYVPSMLLVLATALAFVAGRPALAESPVFALGVSVPVLWLITAINVRGLKAGRVATGGGAIAGWVAAAVLIAAGALAAVRFGSATPFNATTLLHPAGGASALAYFGTLAFGLVGLELAPVMGGEIRDPVRTVPRAIALSGAVVTGLYIAGTAAILVAVPVESVSPLAGALDAVAAVATRVAWQGATVVVAALLCLSVAGQITAWLAGDARLPLVLGVDRYFPPAMAALHPRYGTPHLAVIAQSVIATLLIVMSQTGTTVREAFLVLLDATVVLTFVPFLYIFLAVPRGGRPFQWLVAAAGVLSTLAALASAVVPPPGVRVVQFETRLWGGLAVFTIAGYLLYRRGHAAKGEPVRT
jgi:glutamate:GABA antiporter